MVRNPLLLKIIVIQITKKSKANFMNQKNKNEVRMMENLTSKGKTGN